MGMALPLTSLRHLATLAVAVTTLWGCGGSDSDDSEGALKFYNASPNAPGIFLTLDEDLDSDPDDEIEFTQAAVGYGVASSNRVLPTGRYFMELAWQDEDSTERNDLEIVHEDQIEIRTDAITFVVMSEDVLSPQVNIYDVPIVDDDNDADEDLFNIRFLNLNPLMTSVDLYLSESNETFNEAEFVGNFSYQALSDNFKFEQDQYIVYLTLPGSEEVVFESSEISYEFTTQYVLALRQGGGAAASSFEVDSIGNTNIRTFQAANVEARFRFYNGIQPNELLPEYSGVIDVLSDTTSVGDDRELIVNDLSIGNFSQAFVVERGDYSLDVVDANSALRLVENQLLSLENNADITLFYYLREENVDEDGDGDVDENGDGIIDEREVIVSSVPVTNSSRQRIFDHEVTMLNLVDSEDFGRVTFYFVENDEIIETASNRRGVLLAQPSTLVLRNNTYDVFAVAEIDGTEVILDSDQLVLNEESKALFLLLESAPESVTGYRMSFVEQADD